MTPSAPAVVIGDALIDEMRDETGSVDAPGGSALNVAAGLATLETPAILVAMIGADRDGAVLDSYLGEHGIPVLASPSALGTGRAVSDRTNGEPSYSFNDAAIARKIVFSTDVLEAIEVAPLVAISGFPFDHADQLEQLSRALDGARVAVDANPRLGLVSDANRFGENLLAFAARCELVKIGEDDAHLLYGESAETVASRFVSAGAAAVIATHGPGGATVYLADRVVRRPIAHLTGEPVDMMGAGDATFATVLAGLIRRDFSTDETAWQQILDHAMVVAALTIRAPGGRLRLA